MLDLLDWNLLTEEESDQSFIRGCERTVYTSSAFQQTADVLRVTCQICRLGVKRIGKTSEVWNRNRATIPPLLPAATLLSF
jgi:hypothetical protein